MSEQFTPRAKRLLVIMMVTPWLFLLVYIGAPLLNSQGRHMRAVREHIQSMAPSWHDFRRTHPGFEDTVIPQKTEKKG